MSKCFMLENTYTSVGYFYDFYHIQNMNSFNIIHETLCSVKKKKKKKKELMLNELSRQKPHSTKQY